jgi:hypothetical protein
MLDAAFLEPIFASVRGKDGQSVSLEIKSVREALFAMHRQGLGDFHLDRLEWQITARCLQDAVREPSRENCERAREAVAALAEASRPRLNS